MASVIVLIIMPGGFAYKFTLPLVAEDHDIGILARDDDGRGRRSLLDDDLIMVALSRRGVVGSVKLGLLAVAVYIRVAVTVPIDMLLVSFLDSDVTVGVPIYTPIYPEIVVMAAPVAPVTIPVEIAVEAGSSGAVIIKAVVVITTALPLELLFVEEVAVRIGFTLALDEGG